MNRYLRLFLKIILWLLGGIAALIVLVFILIQIPSVQNFAKNKAVSFLQNKIKTKVQINKLSLDLPKLLVLEGVYFEDQKQDTLLAGDTLKVDISLLKLLNNEVEINEIDLRGITTKIDRSLPDSAFNFDYIINAFVTEDKKETPPSDSTAAMRFSINKINLDRIKVSFNDEVAGNDVNVYLGHFDTKIKDFDLDKMKFNIPKMKLSGLNAKLRQTKAISAKAVAADTLTITSPTTYPDLTLGTVDLSAIKVDYVNTVTAIDTKVDLGSLLVELDKLDMKNQQVAIKSINLENTNGKFALGKTAQKAVSASVDETAKAVTAEKGWTVTLNEFEVKNTNFKFDDLSKPKLSRGIDYMHLDLKNLNGEIADLFYNPDTISGRVNAFSVQEKSGLNLQKFHTDFFYGAQKAYLNDLLLETPNTLIRDQIELTYPSLDALAKDIGSLGVNAKLRNSKLGFKDILTFVPTLASTDPFRKNPNAVLLINGLVNGKVSNLYIPKLEISGLGATRINASAHITGLPDVNKANFDLSIANFSARGSDLAGFIPPGTLPSNIKLPETLQLKGTFKGGLNAFSTNLNLSSSLGSAAVRATLKNGNSKNNQIYNADIRATNLNVGRLISQEKTIGKVSLTATVNGVGTDPKTVNATFKGRVIKAEYNKYTYQNLNLSGSARNGSIAAVANMDDPNIAFDMDAKANMGGKYPKVNLVLNVDSVNLQKLNFYADDLRFHGKIVADLETADPDYLNGSVLLTNSLIAVAGKRYQLDSVSVISTASAEQNSLRIKSEFLSANVNGRYKLTQLAVALQDNINKYFNTSQGNATVSKYEPQQLEFNAKLTRSPLIADLLPDLKELADVSLTGSFDSNTGQLVIKGSVPRVQYLDYNISNLNLNVNTANDSLKYAVTLDQLSSSQLQLLNTSFSGAARDNVLGLNLQVRDASKREQYRMAGTLNAKTNLFEFSLLPNGLLLDYQAWNVAQDNSIQFGDAGILARNFVISRNNQSISINSTPQQLNAPLAVQFKDFRIETLSRIATKDSLLAGGLINGQALVSNLQTSPVFTADLKVDDFSFRGDTVGNIALNVNNEKLNTYAARASITGKGNEINLNGYYFMNGDNSNFDFDLNIANLNMKTIEGFTLGQLEDATGNITGDLKITGTADAPNVRGDVRFNQVGFNITQFGSFYRLQDERISFTSNGIEMNDFTLTDSAGNKAVVDGTIYTKTFTDYRFGLTLNTDDFEVLNSTREDNDLFYGVLVIDTRLRISGDMNAPVVDGNLSVKDKTTLTVVVPQSDPGIIEREGVVEFIDKDDPKLNDILAAAKDSLSKTTMTGMDVSVNIDVSKEAEFNLIIDEANGDFLHVKGAADLNGGIDPSGKVTLTGTFEVEEGGYNLSFNFIKREFQIRKGSTVTWTGEPMTANVDVTAIYVAETAPLDLVQNQLAGQGATPNVINTYKQELPFQVLLTMKGELLTPEITFDIDLPEGNYGVSSEVVSTVDARLAQLRQEPSELNKQVFAVLLLNRFVSDNPFESAAGGGGVSSLARQSASKLLSEQLNNLVGGMIAGFDLNFDLNSTEDYTTGELKNRSDLTVGLSKRLLSDRLTVNIGSNFELEGPQGTNRKTNNIAGDVSAEYQLTKDGRYLIRAYRKNEYIVVQGQVIETGLGFALTADYNQFRELFEKKTEEQKQQKERMKEQRKARKEEAPEAPQDTTSTR